MHPLLLVILLYTCVLSFHKCLSLIIIVRDDYLGFNSIFECPLTISLTLSNPHHQFTKHYTEHLEN